MASQDASQSLLACWPSCGLWGSRYALPRSVCRANCKLNKANELQSVREGGGEGRAKGEEERRGWKRCRRKRAERKVGISVKSAAKKQPKLLRSEEIESAQGGEGGGLKTANL